MYPPDYKLQSLQVPCTCHDTVLTQSRCTFKNNNKEATNRCNVTDQYIKLLESYAGRLITKQNWYHLSYFVTAIIKHLIQRIKKKFVLLSVVHKQHIFLKLVNEFFKETNNFVSLLCVKRSSKQLEIYFSWMSCSYLLKNIWTYNGIDKMTPRQCQDTIITTAITQKQLFAL